MGIRKAVGMEQTKMGWMVEKFQDIREEHERMGEGKTTIVYAEMARHLEEGVEGYTRCGRAR